MFATNSRIRCDAIAPDLLSGQTYADVDGARKAISALRRTVQADLDATSAYALRFRRATAPYGLRVCWGGGWTFSYANMNSKLNAAYSFTTGCDDAANGEHHCPSYGFYAENDERVNATIRRQRN